MDITTEKKANAVSHLITSNHLLLDFLSCFFPLPLPQNQPSNSAASLFPKQEKEALFFQRSLNVVLLCLSYLLLKAELGDLS